MLSTPQENYGFAQFGPFFGTFLKISLGPSLESMKISRPPENFANDMNPPKETKNGVPPPPS